GGYPCGLQIANVASVDRVLGRGATRVVIVLPRAAPVGLYQDARPAAGSTRLRTGAEHRLCCKRGAYGPGACGFIRLRCGYCWYADTRGEQRIDYELSADSIDHDFLSWLDSIGEDVKHRQCETHARALPSSGCCEFRNWC